jgi:uncharacterized protein
MGAEEDGAVVRRGYEAFNTGDMETLLGLFDETPPGTPQAEARWPATTRAAMRPSRTSVSWGEQTGGTFRATLEQLTAGDGRAVGIHHKTGERDGKQLDVECCLVFQLKDGKIVDGREHFEDLYSWDDFWS